VSDTDSAPPKKDPNGQAAGAPDKSASEDVVLIGGPVANGEGVRVLRKRADSIEFGEMRSVKEGRPIHGEIVRLTPRSEHDRLFDVEVLASQKELAGKTGLGHAGPAQVATHAYRENWDAIFGPREALN
jgi:hypothetical protein